MEADVLEKMAVEASRVHKIMTRTRGETERALGISIRLLSEMCDSLVKSGRYPDRIKCMLSISERADREERDLR